MLWISDREKKLLTRLHFSSHSTAIPSVKSRHWAVQCDGEVQANADYEANEVINKINHPISELFELFSALLCFASTLPEQMLPELSLPFRDDGSNWGGGGGGAWVGYGGSLSLSSLWRRRMGPRVRAAESDGPGAAWSGGRGTLRSFVPLHRHLWEV